MILDIIVRLRVRSAWSERLCVGGVHKVCTVRAAHAEGPHGERSAAQAGGIPG